MSIFRAIIKKLDYRSDVRFNAETSSGSYRGIVSNFRYIVLWKTTIVFLNTFRKFWGGNRRWGANAVYQNAKWGG